MSHSAAPSRLALDQACEVCKAAVPVSAENGGSAWAGGGFSRSGWPPSVARGSAPAPPAHRPEPGARARRVGAGEDRPHLEWSLQEQASPAQSTLDLGESAQQSSVLSAATAGSTDTRSLVWGIVSINPDPIVQMTAIDGMLYTGPPESYTSVAFSR